eukprot:CAMPEP_0198683054 /NCGR_PEP_ID=MMETSP1468-20131203/9937_1 /TAXON_ID=1461545 /ORGANISM="Mantoniella sp, Strain CCMP1436" /LENGTH=122 /DNA_ID=CAMNT_0044426691 /DNA_START=482 /DNA_END=850 /DNA_ORIENTATION=-
MPSRPHHSRYRRHLTTCNLRGNDLEFQRGARGGGSGHTHPQSSSSTSQAVKPPIVKSRRGPRHFVTCGDVSERSCLFCVRPEELKCERQEWVTSRGVRQGVGGGNRPERNMMDGTGRSLHAG